MAERGRSTVARYWATASKTIEFVAFLVGFVAVMVFFASGWSDERLAGLSGPVHWLTGLELGPFLRRAITFGLVILPVAWLSTALHEAAHAVALTLAGAKVRTIRVWSAPERAFTVAGTTILLGRRLGGGRVEYDVDSPLGPARTVICLGAGLAANAALAIVAIAFVDRRHETAAVVACAVLLTQLTTLSNNAVPGFGLGVDGSVRPNDALRIHQAVDPHADRWSEITALLDDDDHDAAFVAVETYLAELATVRRSRQARWAEQRLQLWWIEAAIVSREPHHLAEAEQRIQRLLASVRPSQRHPVEVAWIRLRFAAGRPAEVVAAIDEHPAGQPFGNVGLRYQALVRIGAFDRALALLQPLVDPSARRGITAETLNTAADAVAVAGCAEHLADATSWAELAAEISPESIPIAATLAALQILGGGAPSAVDDLDRAIEYLEQRPQLRVERGETEMFLARAALDAGDVDDAGNHARAARCRGAVSPVLDGVLDELGKRAE